MRRGRMSIMLTAWSLSMVQFTQGSVTSLMDGSEVTGWMESGFVQMKTNTWTTVTTTASFTNPIIFLSTPLYLHGRNEYPHPLEARVKNLQINGIGVAQFQGKLIFPNDSYCSKQWWIPVDYPTGLDVSWLAVEKGGYLLDGTTQLVAGTGSVSGTVTKIDWQYKFGTSCNYPTQEGDTDYAPSAVFELQTTNNGNYFLNVRTTTWWYKTEFSKCSYAWSTGRFFLEPHDGIPEEVLYNYATETLGYLLYDPKQQVIDCLEGTKIQFGVIDVISDVSVKLYLPSGINLAQDSIGVFASVIGYHGGDSVSPTSYGDTSISSNEVYLFLQEDQCGDEETMHFDEESSVLVITFASSACESNDPVVIAYTSPPTLAPSPHPSSVPTLSLLQTESNPTKSHLRDSGLFLAVVLPLIIVSVMAVVGITSRVFFVKLPTADQMPPMGDF